MLSDNLKMLFISDNDDMIQYTQNSIDELQITPPEHVKTFKDAWDKLNTSQDVQILIVDFNMNTEGLNDFLSELRFDSVYGKSPAILLTPDNSREGLTEEIQLKTHGILERPFSPEDLKKELILSFLRAHM